MNKKKIYLCLVLFWGLLGAVNAESYVLIVNAKNGFSGSEEQAKLSVKRMFLKQVSSWPSGHSVKAIARSNDDGASKAFLDNILQMSESELASHWLSLKQKTGETPPRKVKSASSVIKLVGRKQGAFSYISKHDAKDLPEQTKVLFSF